MDPSPESILSKFKELETIFLRSVEVFRWTNAGARGSAQADRELVAANPIPKNSAGFCGNHRPHSTQGDGPELEERWRFLWNWLLGLSGRESVDLASIWAQPATVLRLAASSDTSPLISPIVSPNINSDSPDVRVEVPATGESSGGHKFIDFEEVFQRGHAPIKHIIVRFPPQDGSWYILRCREHNLNFSTNPIRGAARHLSSARHGHLPRHHTLAIRRLGIEVRNCSAQLAEENNAIARGAFRAARSQKVWNDAMKRRDEADAVPAGAGSYCGTSSRTAGLDTVNPTTMPNFRHPVQNAKGAWGRARRTQHADGEKVASML